MKKNANSEAKKMRRDYKKGRGDKVGTFEARAVVYNKTSKKKE